MFIIPHGGVMDVLPLECMVMGGDEMGQRDTCTSWTNQIHIREIKLVLYT